MRPWFGLFLIMSCMESSFKNRKKIGNGKGETGGGSREAEDAVGRLEKWRPETGGGRQNEEQGVGRKAVRSLQSAVGRREKGRPINLLIAKRVWIEIFITLHIF